MSHGHPPDDFSHLPTVDMEHLDEHDPQELWRRHRQTAIAAAPVVPEPPPAQPQHCAQPGPAHEDAAPDFLDAIMQAPEPPVAPQQPDMRALWQEFEQAAAESASSDPHQEPPPRLEYHEEPRLLIEEHHHEEPAHDQMPVIQPLTPPEAVHVEDAQEQHLEREPADIMAELKRATRRAFLLTIGVHLAVVALLALMHTAVMEFKRPEIVAINSVDEQEAPDWKKVTTAAPQTSAMAATISPLLATGASSFAMPAVDFDSTATQLNLGSTMGSFGISGAGGKISFLGNTANASHVVFVVDLSSSMLARSLLAGSQDSISRFELLKKELSKSIGRLPTTTFYQILFFSDFAIAHDVVDTNDPTRLDKAKWDIRSGQRSVRIPNFQYIQASRAHVSNSQRVIEESSTFGGTNWGSGLRMALNGSPKPDVIFFMTDGDAGDEQGWANDVTENNSRGKRTIIHTTAMMVPGAAKALDEIARRNGGKFTIVQPDGKVLTGEQFFKQGGG